MLLHEDTIAYVQTPLELSDHDIPCGVGDVEGGVLLGVGRCDDGHQVIPVGRIDLKTIRW